MLTPRGAAVLGIKVEIKALLKRDSLSDCDYGMIRGYSNSLFHLGYIGEREYRDICTKAINKWNL